MKIKEESISPEGIKKRVAEFTEKHGTDPEKWPKYDNFAAAANDTSFQVNEDTFQQSCAFNLNYSFLSMQAPVPIAFLTLNTSFEEEETAWQFGGSATNIHIGGEIKGSGTIYFDDASALRQQKDFTVTFDMENNTITVSWGSAGYATINASPLYRAPLAGAGNWRKE